MKNKIRKLIHHLIGKRFFGWWYQHRLPRELREMLADYKRYGEQKYTSNFWIDINHNHISTLARHGYDNFKHTIAQSYFTWIKIKDDSQMQFLMQHLNKFKIDWAQNLAKRLPVFHYTSPENSRLFNTTTLLLWQYVQEQGLQEELNQLAEPSEGASPTINFEGRSISQDIANSLLEFDSINSHIPSGSVQTVLEIGAGYGRDAYVWMRLGAIRQYIIVDIPPALYISQKYLMSQFPEKKVLQYKDFNTFEEIKKEFENSEMVFLAPWQVDLLPENIVDLSCAIDSIHEMRLDLVKSYLESVDRITKKYFYMKCWKESVNVFDGIKLNRGEYPIPARWVELMNKECRVQTKYFEALYDLSKKHCHRLKVFPGTR